MVELVDAEECGGLGEGEEPLGLEPLGVALEVVGSAEVEHDRVVKGLFMPERWPAG